MRAGPRQWLFGGKLQEDWSGCHKTLDLDLDWFLAERVGPTRRASGRLEQVELFLRRKKAEECLQRCFLITLPPRLFRNSCLDTLNRGSVTLHPTQTVSIISRNPGTPFDLSYAFPISIFSPEPSARLASAQGSMPPAIEAVFPVCTPPDFCNPSFCVMSQSGHIFPFCMSFLFAAFSFGYFFFFFYSLCRFPPGKLQRRGSRRVHQPTAAMRVLLPRKICLCASRLLHSGFYFSRRDAQKGRRHLQPKSENRRSWEAAC